MVPLLVVIETLIVALGAWLLARRATPSIPPHGPRLAAIGALLLGQAAVLALLVGTAERLDWSGRTPVHGLVWGTQAARAALLLAAGGLWFGLVRGQLGPWRRMILCAGLFALGWGSGPVPFLGFVGLVVLAGRLDWPRHLTGWRHVLGLTAGAVLLLALTVVPEIQVGPKVSILLSPLTDPWPPRLLRGDLPAALRLELDLARPLDRSVQALVDLFRAQLLSLVLHLFSLPVRLSGMSIKRQLLVNHLLVRVIPSVLSFLTLALVGWIAFGLNKAATARAAFERILAGATSAAAALASDPGAVLGEPGSAARLVAARAWLGAEGDRAQVLVREWEVARDSAAARDSASVRAAETVLAATPDAPEALHALMLPRTKDGALEGMVQAGGTLWLASRRVSDAPLGRVVEVFVPIDSLRLASLAGRLRAQARLKLRPEVTVADRGMAIRDDTTRASPVVVAAGEEQAPGARRFFLARSFLPLGDWRSGWRAGQQGAVELTLEVTAAQLLRGLRDLPSWLFSNFFMLGLLLAMATLIGFIDGVAVRFGRGIVRSVEEDVSTLRDAAARLGAGDLDHRVPVRGKDELSVLAVSFNEMAANLKRQRAELVEKERLEEDLEVARQIQRRFLPQRSPVVPGLEVVGISRPSREVGGDLYHFVELSAGRLGIALGDVSGKSVPAALLMSNVMSALRAEVLHESEVEMSLARINRLLVDQIEPGRFVTLFYGVAEPGDARLRYASAGHNPPLRVTAAGEAHWLGEGGVPLGVLPDARYSVASTPFEPGDIVVIYSDGLTEAEGPARDGGDPELFGEARLAESVTASRARPAGEIVQSLLAAVERFARGMPQADDITLVVLKRLEV